MKTNITSCIVFCILLCLHRAGATTNLTTRCTAGGMRVSLSADTNVYTVKQTIIVTLTILESPVFS
jgi:hypothetical protein